MIEGYFYLPQQENKTDKKEKVQFKSDAWLKMKGLFRECMTKQTDNDFETSWQ